MSEELSARISLLDAQVVDSDHLPVGRIDDLELEPAPEGESLVVSALLTGSEALGQRLGGLTGGAMAEVSAAVRGSPGPTAIDPGLVEEVEPMVELSVPLKDLEGVAALERWLGARLISKLPGAGRAVE